MNDEEKTVHENDGEQRDDDWVENDDDGDDVRYRIRGCVKTSNQNTHFASKCNKEIKKNTSKSNFCLLFRN
jgi:hypothetical protein